MKPDLSDAETLGADQIDEMRASRAYADSIALLAEISHISSIKLGYTSLTEQTWTRSL